MKLLLILFFICIYILHAFGNTSVIIVDNLPEKKTLIDDFYQLVRYEPMCVQWSPEWDYQTPKKKILSFLKHFYEKIVAVSEKYPENVEILLLKVLIETYQYNLDIGDYENTIKDIILQIKKTGKVDYRSTWFYANFLYKSSHPYEAWKEFYSIIEAHPYQALSPNFWEDYAQFAYMSMMPGNVRMAISYARELYGLPSLFEKRFFKNIKNMTQKIPLDSELAWEEVWLIEKDIIKDSYVCVNRLFGLSITIDQSWDDLNCSGLSNAKTYFYCSTGPVSGLNKSDVYYSISICAEVVENKVSITDYVADHFSKYGSPEKIDYPTKLLDADVFFYKNDNLYPEQGGSRFLIFALRREKPQWPGMLIERPGYPRSQTDEAKSSDIQYFIAKPLFERFDGLIYYLIILDTCAFAYEISCKTLKDFINNRLLIE